MVERSFLGCRFLEFYLIIMESKISNEYIENVIKELEKFLGVKEPIPDKDIFLLIKNGKVKDAIKLIALQFGLPIDISITNVPNDYRSQGGDNQFHSTHLAKVHGSGSEGITAQVAIPSGVPFSPKWLSNKC